MSDDNQLTRDTDEFTRVWLAQGGPEAIDEYFFCRFVLRAALTLTSIAIICWVFFAGWTETIFCGVMFWTAYFAARDYREAEDNLLHTTNEITRHMHELIVEQRLALQAHNFPIAAKLH